MTIRGFCHCWPILLVCKGTSFFICRLQNTMLLTMSAVKLLHQWKRSVSWRWHPPTFRGKYLISRRIVCKWETTTNEFSGSIERERGRRETTTAAAAAATKSATQTHPRGRNHWRVKNRRNVATSVLIETGALHVAAACPPLYGRRWRSPRHDLHVVKKRFFAVKYAIAVALHRKAT